MSDKWALMMVSLLPASAEILPLHLYGSGIKNILIQIHSKEFQNSSSPQHNEGVQLCCTPLASGHMNLSLNNSANFLERVDGWTSTNTTLIRGSD